MFIQQAEHVAIDVQRKDRGLSLSSGIYILILKFDQRSFPINIF